MIWNQPSSRAGKLWCVRVLVLSPLVPGRGGSGGQTREFHLLSRLVQRGHEVVVCCPVSVRQSPQIQDALAAGIEVRAANRPDSRVAETVAATLRRPALLGQLATRPVGAWQLEILWKSIGPDVAQECRRAPDVVLVVWDQAAAWRAHLPARQPAVLSLHDTTWAYLDGRGDATPGLRGRALQLDAVRARRFAARWIPPFDGVICVSECDARRVRDVVADAAVSVVDNGVDLERLRPLAEPDPAEPATVIFTGTLDYPPNTAGAIWLAMRVWPVVRARLPDARLRIAGRNPPRSILALAGADGIEVHGDVPDMQPLFAAAHVATAPLLSGGGTRLKILEAAAYGRAVVSTTLGAEGLALETVLADSPDAFASALVRLLLDAQSRVELAAAARSAVESRYGWAGLGDQLAEALTRARR